MRLSLLTEYLPRHWHQKGLDWGRVAVIWLSYILSEGDHRKVMVREWVNQRKNLLEQVCGISIRHLQQFLKRGLKPLFYRFKIIVFGDV
jgi:transposase